MMPLEPDMIQVAEAVDRCRSHGVYAPRYGVLDVSLAHSGSQFTFTQTTGGRAEITVFNDFDAATAPGGFVIRIDYTEPDVMLELWRGTTGQFDGFDRFGRIVDQQWRYYGGTPADRDRYKYGYDLLCLDPLSEDHHVMSEHAEQHVAAAAPRGFAGQR